METGAILSLINSLPPVFGAPGLSPEEVGVLEFYTGYGPLVFSHEGCNCADCQTGRKWAENLEVLRALIKRAKDTPPPAPTPPPEPKAPAFSDLVRFDLLKGLAIRAINEEALRDPCNQAVWEMKRRLEEANTLERLNQLLADECEDDWLQGYVRARVVELISELGLAPSGEAKRS